MKILFLYPSKWGRGITPIWVASHTSLLRHHGHKVSYFDCTFFAEWTDNENETNTLRGQYKSSDYDFSELSSCSSLISSLEETISDFQPDIVMWSAISSHIHGEGEYVNLYYGLDILTQIKKPIHTNYVTGGIRVTAEYESVLSHPYIDYILIGDSEFPLLDLVNYLSQPLNRQKLPALLPPGVVSRKQQPIKQPRVKLSDLPPYDYTIFPDKAFKRPYNGVIYNAVDYELSRGCPYTCSYCVETAIQTYYGHTTSNKAGVLDGASEYLTAKSIENVLSEFSQFTQLNIEYIRYQDTNFLTVHRQLLLALADFYSTNYINLPFGYIETRPESITPSSVKLLKALKIDGVGMGIETSAESFRTDELHRFASQEKTIKAFELLRQAGIRRTSYNVIGFPNQTEEDILSTIAFNKQLNPDNITCAFYSPFVGTVSYNKSLHTLNALSFNESTIDPQIRSIVPDLSISPDKLKYYKDHFTSLCRS